MTTTYDASSIRVLEGLDAVRLRPGMYLGGKDRLDYAKSMFRMLLSRGLRLGGGARLEHQGKRWVYTDPFPICRRPEELRSVAGLHGGSDDHQAFTYVAALSAGVVFETSIGSRAWQIHTVRGKLASSAMPVGEKRSPGTRLEFALDTDIVTTPSDAELLDAAWDAVCWHSPRSARVLEQSLVAPNGVLDHPIVRSNPTPPVRARVGGTEVALAWATDESDPVVRVLGPHWGMDRLIVRTLKKALGMNADALLPGLRVVASLVGGWDDDQRRDELEQAVVLAAFEHRRIGRFAG